MEYQYIPKGVCARSMTVELDGNTIREVRIEGGCDGNLQGLSRLVKGMDVDVAIEKMAGIRCGHKSTSCPDQLAKALLEAKEKTAK